MSLFPASRWERVREVVWALVEPATPELSPRLHRASRAVDAVVLGLIALNVVLMVLLSVAALRPRLLPIVAVTDLVTVAVFSAEYVARLWSRTAAVPGAHPIGERVRYALRPMTLIDLLAVLPFYLPMLGVDLVVLRSLRLVQFFRVAKAGRYLRTLHLFRRVYVRRREELVMTMMVTGLLLLISASLMYYAEHPVQPEAFSSIPTTMWWAIATLTTVGYGDVYPITALGRILGAVTAVIGIGLFALPAGILGSGFVEEIERRHEEEARQASEGDAPEGACPTCGRIPPAAP